MRTLEETRLCAIEIARLIESHNGQDTVVLDMSSMGSWTDFFVICSVTSATHIRGLMRSVKDHLDENNIETVTKGWSKDDEWNLVDCGDIVIHMMSARAREFYELEKLWFQAERIFGARENK